jgi:hypothetical protein
MARKGTRRRTQRFDHRNRAVQMYLRGMKHADIAAVLGVERSTVTRDIKVAEEWFRNEAVDQLKYERKRSVAELSIVKENFWDGYEESKKPRERSKAAKRKAGESGTVETAEKQTETRVGDPRFLSGVVSTIQEINKLLGLYAPEKVAPTDPTGEYAYEGGQPLSDEERANRVAALLDSARTRRSGAADQSGADMGATKRAAMDGDGE